MKLSFNVPLQTVLGRGSVGQFTGAPVAGAAVIVGGIPTGVPAKAPQAPDQDQAESIPRNHWYPRPA